MGKFDGILFLSDMDGTLLHQAVLSDENRKAVEYFTENGGMFTVATGRAPDFIKKFNLKINAPVISINGTLIYDPKNDCVIKEFSMPCSCLEAAEYAAKNLPILHLNIFIGDSDKAYKPNELDIKEINGPIRKIVFVFETEEDALSAKSTLSEKFSKNTVFERSWNTGVEMRPAFGGKGECLKFLKEYTGAKIAVAAGDYENDISLLKAADIGFAPANAVDDVIAIADKTVVSCEEHAIADIIYNLYDIIRGQA